MPSTRNVTPRPHSVAALLAETVRRHPERAAMREKGLGGWTSATWFDVGRTVAEGARWLAAQRGTGAMSIVAAPSAAHTIVELAALIAGRSVNPVYADAPTTEVARVLTLVAPRWVAVDAAAAPTIADALPAGAEVVPLDELVAAWRARAAERIRTEDGAGFETEAVVAELHAVAAADDGGEPSVYLQSTGTTGPAKVIDLPVSALLAATWAVRDSVDHAHPRFAAILPSGHISHQLINVFAATLLAGEVCYGGGIDTLVEDLRAVRPTVLFGAPLLFDEVIAEVRRGLEGSAIGRWLGRRLADDVARRLDAGEIRRGDVSLVGRLVGGKAARALGLQRAGELFSGTSPLDPEAHALLGALGWFVRNTYGVSECGGAATISGRTTMVPGELGEAVEGMTVTTSAGGEILLRGESLLRGFLGQPPRSVDEPLATGDLASRHGAALRFAGRASRLVDVGGRRLDLDALERDAAAALPGTTVVVAPADDGPALYAFGSRDLDAVRAALPPGLTDEIAALAAVDAVLDGSHGELGPTGKLRRWRVHEVWRDRLVPRRAAALVA